jgi:peptidoglycan/LPS O-acetylase OafA/YrhL
VNATRRRLRRLVTSIRTALSLRPGGERFRLDVQGLRAVAVLLVVFNHAGMPYFSGGFVGVDVFFVISGFLITGWLLRRHFEARHIPIGAFYAARARRILPAAALTLVATAFAAWYFLNFVRASSAISDCLWATVFAANIHFAQVGTDYFALTQPPSPVQQYWTLSVEEQFYLVWPAFLASTLYLLGGRRQRDSVDRRTVERRLGVVIGLAVLASLYWSIRSTPTDPTGSYFSTLTRGWELGSGALLAVSADSLRKLPSATRAAMSWLGLAGIAVACVAFSGSTAFPGDAALLPVCGASLVLIGGTGIQPRWSAVSVLGTPPVRFVGDTSYSFYLWHWPFLIIATEYEGHRLSLATNVVLLALAFGVSVVTYTLYENPIRHSRTLAAVPSSLALWPWSIAILVLVAGSLTLVINTRPSPTLLTIPLPTIRHPISEARHQRRAATRTSQYTAAVAASLSPRRQQLSPTAVELNPPIDSLLSDIPSLGSCQAAESATSEPICDWGDTTSRRTMVVLGDSHAQMWIGAVEQFARTNGWRLIPIVKDACTAGNWTGVGGTPACHKWYRWALQQITHLHPDAVMVSTSYMYAFIKGYDSPAIALGAVARALESRTGKVLIMEDVPYAPSDPTDCLLAHGATFASCTFRQGFAIQSATNAVTAALAPTGAKLIPTAQWFCDERRCPTVIGNMIAYWSPGHVTRTYADWLARPLARELSLALSGARTPRQAQ